MHIEDIHQVSDRPQQITNCYHNQYLPKLTDNWLVTFGMYVCVFVPDYVCCVHLVH